MYDCKPVAYLYLQLQSSRGPNSLIFPFSVSAPILDLQKHISCMEVEESGCTVVPSRDLLYFVVSNGNNGIYASV